MDLYDFNCFPTTQRLALVGKQGVLLAMRQNGGCRKCLYHKGGFFAEVWYQVMDNQLNLVTGFNSNVRLEPYLEQVDFSAILD